MANRNRNSDGNLERFLNRARPLSRLDARLFNSPTFTEREIKPETYGVVSALPWAAVLTLYSGLGLEEAAQLRPRDLRIEHGNGWVIYAEHEAALSGKLKREGHERTVPLHPELERLGLLKYHAALPRNAERLFPNLPVHDSKGKRGPTLGRAFNNWRRNLGINYKDRPLWIFTVYGTPSVR